MSKTLIILVVITTLLPFIHISNKLANLNSLIDTLQTANALLGKQQKKLKARNKHLANQRNKTKRLIKNYRWKVTQRSIKRASKKMAKAGASMIPFAGVAVIAAATADDIDDLCNDIQVAHDLEHELLGETDDATNTENQYCHEAMAEELGKMAEDIRRSIARDFQISHETLTKQAEEMGKNIGRFGDSYVEASRDHYSNTVEYWSKQMERLSSHSSTLR